MTRTLNQRTRAANARKNVSRIMALYHQGTSINKIARTYNISPTLTGEIIHGQGIPVRKMRKERALTNREIAERINTCRQPTRFLWECLWCENTSEEENMPLQCKCGKHKFRRITAPMPLDVSRLDDLDKEARLCLS